ncbi:WXG100 family type VII secretion target [Nocardioides campestrisoli]|uniref:WXG100 family type VII secretion target n=1 Tax=Nocardioides campestrisoli TaxID=2736757 RepID=UPI0015E6D46F|nr:WXG100 family type VII secretion target [Nocardioides campestrisoli]
MSFDGIRVDHGALDQASADLVNAAKRIETRLNDLENELSPLASDWTGSAKESYRQAKQTWDNAMSEMIVLLQQVGGAVQSSNDEYRAADARGANRFS